jgi:hypothetical protein
VGVKRLAKTQSHRRWSFPPSLGEGWGGGERRHNGAPSESHARLTPGRAFRFLMNADHPPAAPTE